MELDFVTGAIIIVLSHFVIAAVFYWRGSRRSGPHKK